MASISWKDSIFTLLCCHTCPSGRTHEYNISIQKFPPVFWLCCSVYFVVGITIGVFDGTYSNILPSWDPSSSIFKCSITAESSYILSFLTVLLTRNSVILITFLYQNLATLPHINGRENFRWGNSVKQIYLNIRYSNMNIEFSGYRYIRYSYLVSCLDMNIFNIHIKKNP